MILFGVEWIGSADGGPEPDAFIRKHATLTA